MALIEGRPYYENAHPFVEVRCRQCLAVFVTALGNALGGCPSCSREDWAGSADWDPDTRRCVARVKGTWPAHP